MTYEEYKDRIKARGLEPVARGDYEDKVEAGYMELVGIDKDAYCALPEKVIEAVSTLARSYRSVVEDAARLRSEAGELVSQVEASDKRGREAQAEAARLREDLGRHDVLIERLLAVLTLDQTRRYMLATMARGEA